MKMLAMLKVTQVVLMQKKILAVKDQNQEIHLIK